MALTTLGEGAAISLGNEHSCRAQEKVGIADNLALVEWLHWWVVRSAGSCHCMCECAMGV